MFDYNFYKKSADYVNAKINFTPEIGIILGSFFGGLENEIENKIEILYKDIPNFLLSTVEMHAGKLIVGTLRGKNVICMSGRFHYYEGYSYEQLAAPIRLFKLLGVQKTILTNAAGAVNAEYKPGEAMIISDHINIFNISTTRGKNIDEFGPRFFGVSDIYTKSLREVARECAKNAKLKVNEGVYMYFCGPQFETAAEIRMARILGADVVGMSTVPEALTAAHCGMPILGIALITNMATGVVSDAEVTGDVEKTAKLVEKEIREYVFDIIEKL